ncbi:MAG: NAD(P)/FAD-dependent oxidoreductase [Halioglobus sp.]
MPEKIDKRALKQKYAEERDKRLRPDGNEQYIKLAGQLSYYLEDPYLPIVEREPKTDHVTVAFVGGGYAGLVTGARLVERGITDIRIIDKAGDFGGTWYWNRYPGAQCDTASMIYLPLLEETGYVPTEKYAHAPEILEHCQRIAKHYNLYRDTLFHTQVTEVRWDDDHSRWQVRTNRGDDFTAQFLCMGTGPLHMPKLPGIAGIEEFEGHSFHTSRWDYAYTGGNPEGAPMERLADKRVALIGTGATAVQCVPHLAAACDTFYVCQRTPSSVDQRANQPLDADWFAEVSTPGWQQRWMENFAINQTGGLVEVDLVDDGWTDIAHRFHRNVAALPEADRGNPAKWAEAWENADMEKMEEIRARVDSVVEDTATAAKLKAWYNQLCKRPCFHDDYLEAFNQPSTTLLDTDGKGVERVTANGVVVAGVEYPVDCIIYGSGFEVGTERLSRTGFEVYGRDGLSLTAYWEAGMRSLHGLTVRNFPNAFFVQPSQAANLISNIPHNIVEAALSIATIVERALDTDSAQVEPALEAEDAWVELIKSGAGLTLPNADCTPGYYNNEGQPIPEQAHSYAGYPQGAPAFFKFIHGWREAGSFQGLEFR